MNLIENFLEYDQASEVFDTITSGDFPWYRNGHIVVHEENLCQMVHTIYKDNHINSSFFPLANNIITEFQKKVDVKIVNIDRIKINLIHQLYHKAEWVENLKHTDSDLDDRISLIYYVLNSDGDTTFYDDLGNVTHKIAPIYNNLIWFKSNTFHRSSIPVVNKHRIVINFVLQIEQDIL
jgi:hypothetical protein